MPGVWVVAATAASPLTFSAACVPGPPVAAAVAATSAATGPNRTGRAKRRNLVLFI
jgi:hypothetical protein